MSKVVVIKTIGGTEIIGVETNVGADHIYLDKPRIVMLQEVEGKVTGVFHNYFISDLNADKTAKIFQHSIESHLESTSQELIDNYLKATDQYKENTIIV